MATGLLPLEARAMRERGFVPSTSYQTVTTWTVPMVRSALQQHAMGIYQQSSCLVDSMFEASPIAAHASIRGAAFSSKSGLPMRVDPSMGVDDRRAKTVAKRVDEIFWDVCPEQELKALHVDGFMLSRGVARLDQWQTRATEWIPRIRRLRPQGLSWSESERIWHYIDGAGCRHPVTPGQNGWILYEPFGCDSHTKGAVSSLGIPYIMWLFARRDAARYSEKFGLPAMAVEEPFVATDDLEGQAKVQATYEQLSKLGQEAIIRLPQSPDPTVKGWGAKWLELSGGSGVDIFFKLLEQLDRQFAASILGRDTTAGQSVGGDGALLVQRVLTEYLQQDASALSDCLREQVWKPYVTYNVDRTKPELAPYPIWDTRPPADLSAKAAALSTFADAATKLVALGVDIEKPLEEFGLRMGPKKAEPKIEPEPEKTDEPEPEEPKDEEAAA